MDCIFDWFHAIQKKGGNFKIAPFFIVINFYKS
jgi:hypothetical protein